jgi:ethanolamine utilization cobalamin adenosyltransferase
MKKYRTPVLTEDHIRRLHELTGEIIIPRGTVITPKARELVRKNQIIITFS